MIRFGCLSFWSPQTLSLGDLECLNQLSPLYTRTNTEFWAKGPRHIFRGGGGGGGLDRFLCLFDDGDLKIYVEGNDRLMDLFKLCLPHLSFFRESMERFLWSCIQRLRSKGGGGGGGREWRKLRRFVSHTHGS